MEDTQCPHKLIKANDVILFCVKKLKHLHMQPICT